MYKAKLISADFESLTLQFKCIGEGFTEIKVPTEDYIILSKEEFEELSEKANNVTAFNLSVDAKEALATLKRAFEIDRESDISDDDLSFLLKEGYISFLQFIEILHEGPNRKNKLKGIFNEDKEKEE